MSDAFPAAVVYDCMVYVQAAFNGYGPAARCLGAAAAGRVRLVCSEAVLVEIADVLGRPRVLRRREHLTPAFLAGFLERIRQVATIVDPIPEHFSYPRDPNDEPYVNLAIASGAVYLVSRDHDLLDLQDPASPPGQELRLLAPQLTILDPVQFLQRLPVLPEETP